MFFLIKKLFNKQIKKLISQAKRQEREKIKDHDRKLKLDSFRISFPIGEKVIYRSNEPDPLLIGHVVDHQIVGMSQNSILAIIKCEETGKEFMPMGSPIVWTKEREESLNKLLWWEQWNLLASSPAAPTFTLKEAKEKEYKQKTKVS